MTLEVKKVFRTIRRNLTHSSPGFTLLEVVLASILIGLFLVGIFAFNLFGIRTFRAGERQTDAHQALRRTADRIASELRYAMEIAISNDPSHFDTHPNHIYYDSTNNRIVISNDRGTYTLEPQHYNIELFFEQGDGQNILSFTIEAKDLPLSSRSQNDNYVITTSVLLHNIRNSDQIEWLNNCDTEKDCNVISYNSPSL